MSFLRYPKYKCNNVEWLGELPAHWSLSRLGFASWVRARLGWKGLKAEEYVDDGYVLLATPNIKGREIDFEHVNFIDQVRYEESPEIALRQGDVLLAKDGSTLGIVNVVRRLPRPATVNSSIAVITPHAQLKGLYLYYLFQSDYLNATIQSIKGGMGVPHLFQQDLNKFAIPLPPIPEQTAISTFLDRETAKIDALVEEQTRLIELLKEKHQAVISHAVTKGLNPDTPMKDTGIDWPQSIPSHWEILNLTRVVEQFVDYRGVTPTKLEEGIPLITATQIKNGRIDHSLDPVFISEEEYGARMTRGFPETGDVLLTTEAPLGEVAMIEEARVSPGQRMILMKVDRSKVTNEFLFRHFQSDFGQNQLAMRASGSTASGIRADRLRGSAVLVPPLDEQKQIAAYIKTNTAGFDDLNAQIGRQLGLLQERRAALISAAVTGRIDVRGLIETQEAAE